jgi:hypothetical protein
MNVECAGGYMLPNRWELLMMGRNPDSKDDEGQPQPFPFCAASEDEIREAKNEVASRAYKDATVELAPVALKHCIRSSVHSRA